MQSSDYLLPEFGQVYEYENQSVSAFLLEAASLSYQVLIIAMKGFTAFAIPIWVTVMLMLS